MMFSIIVPNYNNAQWLDRLFESVCDQRRKDYELIFVDDVSTDDSYEIYRKWADKLPKAYGLKLGKKRWNGGARNAGLAFARGKYTLFLDSDDCFCDNECLDTIGRVIEQNNYPDLVRLSYYYCAGDNEHPVDLSAQDTIEKIVQGQDVACWTKCVKTEKVVPFAENTLKEDVVQHIAQLDAVDTVATCAKPIVRWNRNNPNSTSSNTQLQGGKFLSSLYRKYADLLDLRVNKPECQKELEKRRAQALEDIRKEVTR